jgi:hypothetical protein
MAHKLMSRYSEKLNALIPLSELVFSCANEMETVMINISTVRIRFFVFITSDLVI